MKSQSDLTLTPSSISLPIPSASADLDAFIKEMQHEQFISDDFFQNKSPEERYELLSTSLKNLRFMELLHKDPELTYRFLIKVINNFSGLHKKIRENYLGEHFITPMEQDSFNAALSKWIKTPVSHAFSRGMYDYLCFEFLDESISPKERCDILCALRLVPEFMSHFEKNFACYHFLRKSVANDPELMARLKKTSLGRNFIIPRELELFHKDMIDFVAYDLPREFTDQWYQFLGLDYFKKSAKDKWLTLQGLEQNEGFLNCLKQDKEISDILLRKSTESTELLNQVKTSNFKYYLIPTQLKELRQSLRNLMEKDISLTFTRALLPSIKPEFFSKTKTDAERFLVLNSLIRSDTFLSCLKEDKDIIIDFLRKSLANSPELFVQLTKDLDEDLLVPTRTVRKRKNVQTTQPMGEKVDPDDKNFSKSKFFSRNNANAVQHSTYSQSIGFDM